MLVDNDQFYGDKTLKLQTFFWCGTVQLCENVQAHGSQFGHFCLYLGEVTKLMKSSIDRSSPHLGRTERRTHTTS
jgi:hypothetical protein